MKPFDTSLVTTGRNGDPRLGEWVKPWPKDARDRGVLIIGCPDDTGVTTNRGRAGAKEGPAAIRRHLFKMTPPWDCTDEGQLALFDGGDIEVERDLRATHRNAQAAVAKALKTAHSVVVLGGGHDFAAPGIRGLAEAVGASPKRNNIGLINIDPHLDVREWESDSPHSGSPFRELLQEKVILGKNFCQFGTQENRNAKSHFEFCREQRVRIQPWQKIRLRPSAPAAFAVELRRLASRCSTVGVTLDIDCCFEAEGASAAPVLGFSAAELCAMARFAGTQKKVRYFEIAEVAPRLDSTERSARIAAEILYAFLAAKLF